MAPRAQPAGKCSKPRPSGKKETSIFQDRRDQKHFIDAALRAQSSALNEAKAKAAAEQKWAKMSSNEKKHWTKSLFLFVFCFQYFELFFGFCSEQKGSAKCFSCGESVDMDILCISFRWLFRNRQ
jgi:hypothetical protein